MGYVRHSTEAVGARFRPAAREGTHVSGIVGSERVAGSPKNFHEDETVLGDPREDERASAPPAPAPVVEDVDPTRFDAPGEISSGVFSLPTDPGSGRVISGILPMPDPTPSPRALPAPPPLPSAPQPPQPPPAVPPSQSPGRVLARGSSPRHAAPAPRPATLVPPPAAQQPAAPPPAAQQPPRSPPPPTPPPEGDDMTRVESSGPVRFIQADTAIRPESQHPLQLDRAPAPWEDRDSLTGTRPAMLSLSPLPLQPLPFSELTSGTVVNGHQVVATIGNGPTGAVYACMHPTSGKRVAIRVISHMLAPDAEAIERLLEDNRGLASLGHRGIITVQENGELADGRKWLLMDQGGPSLAAHIKQRGALSLPEAIGHLRSIAAAPDAAHAIGVLHRGLKPSEVHLGEEQGARVVRVSGFGLGRLLLRPDGTLARNKQGEPYVTPHCLAPEQCRGVQSDARSDVYAMGVILYEMLTGRPPFGGDGVLQVLQAHLSAVPTRPNGVNPDLPEWLSDMVLRALEKSPADRFETAGALVREVEQGIRRGVSGAKAARSPAGTNGRWVAVGAAAAIVVLALVMLILRR